MELRPIEKSEREFVGKYKEGTKLPNPAGALEECMYRRLVSIGEIEIAKDGGFYKITPRSTPSIQQIYRNSPVPKGWDQV